MSMFASSPKSMRDYCLGAQIPRFRLDFLADGAEPVYPSSQSGTYYVGESGDRVHYLKGVDVKFSTFEIAHNPLLPLDVSDDTLAASVHSIMQGMVNAIWERVGVLLDCLGKTVPAQVVLAVQTPITVRDADEAGLYGWSIFMKIALGASAVDADNAVDCGWAPPSDSPGPVTVPENWREDRRGYRQWLTASLNSYMFGPIKE